MSAADEKAELEAANRWPAEYYKGYEPSGDYAGRLAYLTGVTTDDLREAFEQGAAWQRQQPIEITDEMVERAAAHIAWAGDGNMPRISGASEASYFQALSKNPDTAGFAEKTRLKARGILETALRGGDQ